MRLFDRRGVFQLLANHKAGHGGKYELRRPGDRGDCYLQPGLLPRVGEESLYGTGHRGDLNALSMYGVLYSFYVDFCTNR